MSRKTEIENLLIVHLSDAIIEFVQQEIGHAFLGGSRGVGYNCLNSDADVYVWVEPTQEQSFRHALESIGFSQQSGEYHCRHQACYVYAIDGIDICIVNEFEDFEKLRVETGVLKGSIKKNKKLTQFMKNMCADNLGERAYTNLLEMQKQKEKEC